jgi:hypothetical protein
LPQQQAKPEHRPEPFPANPHSCTHTPALLTRDYFSPSLSFPLSPPPHTPNRKEALFIGDIYTELLGEFGRFVGGSVNAVTTLKKGLFVSPLALKVGHLEKSLKDLITFLEVGGVGVGVVDLGFCAVVQSLQG